MEVTYGRGYVYSIQYHIVWCVNCFVADVSENTEGQIRKYLQNQKKK